MSKYNSIFLIDDDKDDQFLFRYAMKEISDAIHCAHASDGVSALKTLQGLEELPDLIFLDLNMPIMHGFECLEQIKKSIRIAKIPVLVFTTSNNPSDIRRAKELGASGYFCKPMDFTQLIIHLKEVLSTDFADGKAAGFTRFN
jgi:CheY-like chemotaxis protein